MPTPDNNGAHKRNGERRASLSTLSAHLGLSPAAISRVLNGAPAARSIPKATQERIFEAARQLNYRPNILARSLRRGHSMTMGVLVPEIAEGYTALVLAGLEEVLHAASYFHLLISHHHDPITIDRALATLTERAVDGLIAIDTALPAHVELPTATISCPEVYEGTTAITLGQEAAAELAIGHLASLGHREIAVIKGQVFSSDTETRWKATVAAAKRHGLTLHTELIAELQGNHPTHEPGYRAAQRLLASGVPFSAIFAFNDISAVGAIRALREAGFQVPHDVSVVGFDDIQSAAFQNPSLTTVRQPLRRMGRLAAETLIRRINDGSELPTEGQTVYVDPELVVRESTSGPPSMLKAGRP